MNNPMEFWCVTTDAATGEPVYHQLHDAGYADLEWIRASSSIPFLLIQWQFVDITILMVVYLIRFRMIF